ncbi:Na(+)/H(+) antiporter subunit F1 [Paenibacillaceae bacterium]|nr:Na(+)/H(+) antiporter subunit F1 [Paenibacillaceae bacterium]
MLDTVLHIAVFLMSLSILACLYRVIKGPSLPDRIIALDTIGINVLGLVSIISIQLRTQAYLEFVLLIGIMSFLGTVALAKYIEKGAAIEHARDPVDKR